MAYKNTNVAVQKNSGRVGNVRYYVKAGKTYSRTASSEVSNPRTLSQMAVRCRMANIKSVWQAMSAYLAKCFESANAATSRHSGNLFRQKPRKPLGIVADVSYEPLMTLVFEPTCEQVHRCFQPTTSLPYRGSATITRR